MKKILLLLSMAVIGLAQAQEKTMLERSKALAAQIKKQSEENWEKTYKIAQQKGWEFFKVEKDGTVLQLVGIEIDGLPKYYITYNNSTAAITTGANQLYQGGRAGLNLSGSSTALTNKLAIWDGGRILDTHQEFATGRVTQKDNPTSFSDHATHVTGTMIAAGVNPNARGMSFGARGLLAYDFNNDDAEMAGEASGLLLSNHSYGAISGWRFNDAQSRWEFWGRDGENEDVKFGWYNVDAATWDNMAFTNPNYLIVKSAGNSRNVNGPQVGSNYWRFNASGTMASAGARPAGISNNDGYDIISTAGVAKNILTVGAANGLPFGYSRPSDVVISNFSSWGPSDDGRIKPDIVAMGVGVLSTVASGTSSYSSLSGTSMSSPNATGSLFLLQELYNNLRSGQFMRSATLKGIAIHTAEEAGLFDGPDYKHGWGLLNVEKGAALIQAAVGSNNATTSNHLLYENVLTQGQTFTTTVIASGKGKLKATICWTDSVATVNNNVATNLNDRTSKLINDLDLRINRVGGTITLPWKLDPNVPDNGATKGDNNLDNVEVVEVDSVMPGASYTITITHKATLTNARQAYTLLISGVGGTAYCSSVAASTSGTKIDSVAIGTPVAGGSVIRRKNVSGCTNYTNNLNLTATIEPGSTVPFTVATTTCDATNNNRITKIFADLNNNGIFTDAGELLATSGNLNNTSNTFSGNLTIPNTLTVGNYIVLRIVTQEATAASSVNACGSYNNGETQDYRLQIVPPTNDMALTRIISPASGDCGNAQSFVTVNIKNNGTTAKSNVPVQVTIMQNTTTIATLTGTITDVINAGSTIEYVLPNTFNALSGVSYNITATVTDATDQLASNNTTTGMVSIAARPNAPAGTAAICTPAQSILSVTSPVNNVNYLWFDSPTATAPIAIGNTATVSSTGTGNNFYLQRGIATTSFGLPNKGTSGGGYQINGGSYMNFSASTSLILESARIYTRNPGTLNIVIGDVTPGANNTYTYTSLASKTITVPSTHPNPSAVAETGNDPADNGMVVNLNLPVPAGSHSILVFATGATIFRNNGLPTITPTYPLGNSIFQFTSNSATSTTDPNFHQPFYYYLYDVKMRTADCVSDRATIAATTTATPTITLVNTNLESSVGASYQWYLNSNPISGATNRTHTPTQNGNYSVIVTFANGCSRESAMFAFAATAVINVSNEEIALKASPNPNNGNFRVSFKVNTRANLSISVTDIAGKTIYGKTYNNFIGNFAEQLNIGNVATGNYVLKVQHGNRVYRSTLFVTQ